MSEIPGQISYARKKKKKTVIVNNLLLFLWIIFKTIKSKDITLFYYLFEFNNTIII